MKINIENLRKIIREVSEETGHAAFVKAFDAAYKQPDGSYRGHPDDPEDHRDELATQIRNASKDIHGRKDVYDLEGKSIKDLEDILFDLAHSQEQQAMDDMDRDEMEDKMGRDGDLSRAEMAPRRQGMRRRPAGSKSQRRMESVNKIVREALNERMSNTDMRKTLKDAASQIAGQVPQQFNADVMKIIDMVVAVAHQKKTSDLKRIAQYVSKFSEKAMSKEKGDAAPDDVLDAALSGASDTGKEKSGEEKSSEKETKVVKFD